MKQTKFDCSKKDSNTFKVKAEVKQVAEESEMTTEMIHNRRKYRNRTDDIKMFTETVTKQTQTD